MSDIDLDVMRLAIAAAGPQGNDARAWGLRIAEIVPQIASMFRPPKPGDEDLATTPLVTARKVREASVFAGEFVKFSDEEMSNTHRLLVAFKSQTSDDKEIDGDGLEWLRTEPNWTRAGFVLQKVVRQLEPGQQCVVYKSVEPIAGNRKVRVLVHLDVRGKARTQDRPAQEPQPSPVPTQTVVSAPVGGDAGGAQQVPAPAGSPPAESPDPFDVNDAIGERFNALSPRQRIAFGRLCAGMNIKGFMNPSIEDLDQVLLNMSKVEGEQ